MALSYGTQFFRDLTGAGGTFTVTTPSGVPAGIAVLIAQGTNPAADPVTAVSYGGAALTRITRATCGGEPGASLLYFRGQSVPTTGTVNVVTSGGTYTAWAVTVTGDSGGTAVALRSGMGSLPLFASSCCGSLSGPLSWWRRRPRR